MVVHTVFSRPSALNTPEVALFVPVSLSSVSLESWSSSTLDLSSRSRTRTGFARRAGGGGGTRVEPSAGKYLAAYRFPQSIITTLRRDIYHIGHRSCPRGPVLGTSTLLDSPRVGTQEGGVSHPLPVLLIPTLPMAGQRGEPVLWYRRIKLHKKRRPSTR